jgi:NTP pyrophosphatase (non-canonical NTP hydrolase)
MNLAKWGARVANWKKNGAAQRPIEWHILHLASEVSEVFESLRDIQNNEIRGYDGNEMPENPYSHVYTVEKDGHPHPEGFGIELADVVLVALYIAQVTGVDIEKMMEIKMAANENRRARS